MGCSCGCLEATVDGSEIPNNHLGWLFYPINNGIITTLGGLTIIYRGLTIPVGAGFCPSTVFLPTLDVIFEGASHFAFFSRLHRDS